MVTPLLDAHLAFLEWHKVRLAISERLESQAGKRRARDLLPGFDAAEVERAQARTAEAVELVRRGVAPGLEQVGDLQRHFELAAEQQRSLTSRELRSAARTLQLASEAALVYAAESAPLLGALLARGEAEEESDQGLAAEILRVIGPHGVVFDAASEHLERTRRDLRSALGALQAALTELIRHPSVMLALAQTKPATHRDTYCLKVKPTEIRRVPGPILGDDPGCLYVAPDALRTHYNRIRDLRFDEQQETQRLLRGLSERVTAERERYERLAAGLITCDLHQGFARYGDELDLVPPRPTEGLTLELREARHPLLAEEGSCVPIDVALGADRRLLVITGPNGGGKTVAMKTVGLAAALAQAGCWVPATEARLPVFERFLSVADSTSSVSEKVSTFQAHARDLTAVAEACAPHSLVLLDEIGVGTDPGEAGALAQAFLEHLREADSLVLATTHLAPLKVFAQESPAAIAAMVELDDGGLPTFRLAMGEVGRSYAIDVARRAGLPETICDRAAELHRGGA